MCRLPCFSRGTAAPVLTSPLFSVSWPAALPPAVYLRDALIRSLKKNQTLNLKMKLDQLDNRSTRKSLSVEINVFI